MSDTESPSLATDPFDAMAKAPDHHFRLLENDKVRVLDTIVRPSECTPVHGHGWPAALYVLRWSDFVRFDAGGNKLFDSRGMAFIRHGCVVKSLFDTAT